MLINKEDNVVTFTRESSSFLEFVKKFFLEYPAYRQYNLVINLFSLEKLSVDNLLEFLEISEKHRNDKKSFVLVTDVLNIDELPEELVVAPTLQEAMDIIEMEEIERDLDF